MHIIVNYLLSRFYLLEAIYFKKTNIIISDQNIATVVFHFHFIEVIKLRQT